MYGTVDASAHWQAHYVQILKENAFGQGLIHPSLCERGTGYSTARSR